jgi:hypothetical protein
VPNASSQFLRSANSASPNNGVQTPSDTDVLSVASPAGAKAVESLAIELGTLPALLWPVVRKLSSDGFLTFETEGSVKLSEAGERALRYTKVANL